MAVINFTEADRLSSTIVPTDWYRAEVTEIEGPKKSSSDKSFHFFTKFGFVGEKFTGKELSLSFNTGTRSPSVLGTMQFFPTAWMMKLYAAIYDVPLESVPAQIDTELLLRKPFDLKVEKGIHEGIPMNTVLDFLPAGKGMDQKAPF